MKYEGDIMHYDLHALAGAQSQDDLGKDFTFYDEGHGFRKKNNQIEGHEAVLKFLDNYLKKGP